jgi:hypothetical protein
MTSRTTALALAILFAVSAGALAGPASCCVPNGQAERVLIAVDCCATMVDCPIQLKATGTAILQTVAPTPADPGSLLAPELPNLTPIPARPFSVLESHDPLGGSPPLYRLHSQLLI